MASNQFFSDKELACKCCGVNGIKEEFLEFLTRVRKKFGPMVVTSGYRCPKHNSKVSSTGKDGPHTTGMAADIYVRGARANTLLKIAYEEGVKGVGVNQKGNSRFIHLDLLEDRIWSY